MVRANWTEFRRQTPEEHHERKTVTQKAKRKKSGAVHSNTRLNEINMYNSVDLCLSDIASLVCGGDFICLFTNALFSLATAVRASALHIQWLGSGYCLCYHYSLWCEIEREPRYAFSLYIHISGLLQTLSFRNCVYWKLVWAKENVSLQCTVHDIRKRNTYVWIACLSGGFSVLLCY